MGAVSKLGDGSTRNKAPMKTKIITVAIKKLVQYSCTSEFLDHPSQQRVNLVSAWTTFSAVGKQPRPFLPASGRRIQPEQQQECVDILEVRPDGNNLVDDVFEADYIQMPYNVTPTSTSQTPGFIATQQMHTKTIYIRHLKAKITNSHSLNL